MLLQVLDEGRMTDGQGRRVDFKNAVRQCRLTHGDPGPHRALADAARELKIDFDSGYRV